MDVDAFSAKTLVDTLRGVVGLIKDIWDTLPDGDEKEAVANALDEAVRETRLVELQIAEAYDYAICKCEFPPVICELHQVDEQGQEQFKCPKCGRLYPPKQALPLHRNKSHYKRGPI